MSDKVERARGQVMTEDLVAKLFPGNPLLCRGLRVKADCGTGTREKWRGQLTGFHLKDRFDVLFFLHAILNSSERITALPAFRS